MNRPAFTRVCAFLAIGAGVIFAANADVKWTYASNVLTGIAAEGETATVFTLSDAGELSVKTAGTQKEIDLRSAALPDGAPSIKTMGVIAGCSAMETLYLPESVEELKYGFCQRATALKQIVFPANCKVTTIPGVAFYYCTKLEGVEIPEGVKEIGWKAFEGASAMRRVKLPETLEVLGECAFCNCTGLVEVKPFLPNSVTNIGIQAFYGKSAMAITNDLRIGFGEKEVTFAVDANNENQAFARCSLPSVKYGPMVKKVPRVFYCGGYCGVKYLEVGENVVEFDDCMGLATNLAKVVFKTTKDLTFPPQTFSNYSKFPGSVKEIVFNGWVNWSAGTGNPFGMSSFRSRFIVPGDNAKWAKYIADARKVQPFVEAPGNVQKAYWDSVKPYIEGADETAPVGVTLADGVIPNIYIMTDGTEMAKSLVAVDTLPSVLGTVAVEPESADGLYENGTSVKVKFTSAADVEFVCWEGDIDASVKSNAEVTVAANGVINLMPRVKANFLAYDKEAGELTDGNWVLAASGEKEGIVLGAFKRANFTTGVSNYGPKYEAFVLDLSKDVRTAEGAGAIVEFTQPKFGSACSYASKVILPNTLRKTASGNVFQNATIPIEPKLPDSVTTIGSALFADTNNKNINGNFRVGFAQDAEGNYLTTTIGSDTFTRGGQYMGPKVEIGPGVKSLPGNMFWTDYGCNYAGELEVWFGPNLASAAETAMGTSFGGTNGVSFHFQGDMFKGTSKMFSKTTTAKSNYRYRFYIGAEGCKKWQEFMENTDYVTPWKNLGETIQAEYKKHFKGTPYGLTTAAAALSDGSGLPEAVWVISLKPTGLCIRIQ